jgi:fructose-1,6-bisphosphatase/inositol monophosphatase family enzyme
VVSGVPVLSVIYAPISGWVVAAEKGAGAYADGERLPVNEDPASFESLRGAVMTHFMPETIAQQVASRAASLGERLRGLRACAFEYPAVATGDRDFALFSKTMPWDHAPGAVLLGETGGAMRYLDGTDYTPRSQRRGLLAARSPATWDAVAGGLFPEGDPY